MPPIPRALQPNAWLATLLAAVLGLGACTAVADDEPAPDAAPTRSVDGSRDAAASAESPARRTYRVRSVTDGDTVLLGNGETVRLVGVDTPEHGVCGSERAAALLARLVLGEQVRLTAPVDDRDRYGRLLRYVDVGNVDAGRRLIGRGLAIARYDSRDGYDRHPRQRRYVATDRSSADERCVPPPVPSHPMAPVPLSGGPSKGCAPGYSPCIPAYPPDLDCADTGPVTVSGADPHVLDADGDGRACGSY